MADTSLPPPTSPTPAAGGANRPRVVRAAHMSARSGPPASKLRSEGVYYVWLSSLAVVLVLLMVVGMVVLILVNGFGHFWPTALVQISVRGGKRYLGEIHSHEPRPQSRRERLRGAPKQYRTKLKIGNRELVGSDFVWIDDDQILRRDRPRDAMIFERLEYGNFYGWLREVRSGKRRIAGSGDKGVEALRRQFSIATALRKEMESLRQRQQDLRAPLTRLERRLAALRGSRSLQAGKGTEEFNRLRQQRQRLHERLQPELQRLGRRLQRLRPQRDKLVAVMATAAGPTTTIKLADIVLISLPNSMGPLDKIGHYLWKLREFVWANPRESNTEGGVFPAIYGTVLLVMLMTVAVVPFGVVAAVYMHEYAKRGRVLRIVRVAVNNLAGVPSIVVGMFGLAFFVYGVGGLIDRLLYSQYLPTPTVGTGGILWASMTLALLTLPVVIVATEEGLAAVPQAYREASLALGTTKWQTISRVVLPNATPGILTGIILAVSRAAGEVAPLMLTGVVKLAPALPADSTWPFLHLERKFMHLGFHIYDVAMQSPNVEAAMPMVYSTTALLLLLVLLLNSAATIGRSRLRRRYAGARL